MAFDNLVSKMPTSREERRVAKGKPAKGKQAKAGSTKATKRQRRAAQAETGKARSEAARARRAGNGTEAPSGDGGGKQYVRAKLDKGYKRLPGGAVVDAATVAKTKAAKSERKARIAGRQRLRIDRHNGTTAHCCTLFPFGVHSSSGYEGVYLGRDMLTNGEEAFFYDPFVIYRDFSGMGATNTNMLIVGQPGMGKSALVKTLLYRLGGVYGSQRFLAIVDVKSEYGVLAERLGLPVVKLTPGGSVRVNPLERRRTDGGMESQGRLMGALLSASLRRRLEPVEEVLLWAAVRDCCEASSEATLADLRRALNAPSVRALEAARLEAREAHNASQELVFATDGLLDRDLRGMFDGRSTVKVDASMPGVVLDISEVQHDSEALPLVMTAATAWLMELIVSDPTGKRKIQLLDECWRMVSFEGTARFLQASWKLGRTFGVANIAVLHKPGDLAAQADDGTATSKIAAGLVADTAVRVSFAQTREDLKVYGDVLGFSERERAEVNGLSRGESFWKIGTHTVVLDHVISKTGPEMRICDTDQAVAEAAL